MKPDQLGVAPQVLSLLRFFANKFIFFSVPLLLRMLAKNESFGT